MIDRKSGQLKNMIQKISILHVTTRLDQGGVEYWLLNNCKYVNASKFKMDICLIGRRGIRGSLADQFIENKCLVHVIPFRNLIKFQVDFAKIAKNYQVIILNTNIFTAPFVLIASIFGRVKTRLIMLHNTYFSIPSKALGLDHAYALQRFLKPVFVWFNRILSSGIMGCSSAALSSFYPHWQKNGKYKLLRLGIEIDRFSGLKENKRLRESLSIPTGAHVIGHVGRFVQQKNHAQIVHVARCLLSDYPNLIFLLVGDGPLREETMLLAKKLGVLKSFRFTGFRSDVPDLMTLMDIAFFPSLHEGSPVTFIEAQVIGLPVVTGTRPELKEAICPDNHPYCLTDVLDFQKSAQKLKFLLDNPKNRIQIGKIGHEWAVKEFSIQTSTATLEKYIEEYIQQNK